MTPFRTQKDIPGRGDHSPPSVLITGCSTGIGHATATLLAGHGWQVFAGVRNVTTAPDTSAGRIVPVHLDVTDHASIAAATGRIRGDLGEAPLDAVINNAGVGELAPMQAVEIDTLRRIFEVNVFGAVALTQATLPMMCPGGRVVFVGSVGDRITMPFGGPLTSSKWAVASISEAFRLELRASGIDVVLIEPGSIHTTAVGKVEEAARRLADSLEDTDPRLAHRFRTAAAVAVRNERGGSAPDVVATTIARALTSSAPRTRYLTGRHARLLATLGRLPDPVFDHLRLRLFQQPTTPQPPATPPRVPHLPHPTGDVMTLPGLDRLAAISPDFAAEAARLGDAAWNTDRRTVLETTAAFIGCDLALGLLDLPLTLHATMARRLGVTDSQLVSLLVGLAPALGYPPAAQALVALDPQYSDTPVAIGDGVIKLGLSAARAVLGLEVNQESLDRICDITAEYGTIRLRSKRI